ncbi:hypothetical protein [Planktothricoides raciborskii]|nr:hypothetical protein [Planktothricoides raciborskii]
MAIRPYIETRFLGKLTTREPQKPGFFRLSLPPHQNYYRNPVSW